CTGVQILDGDVAQARTPPAPFPIPADGKVDAEFVIPPSIPTILAKGFTYTLGGGFVRGDVTNDGFVDISDAVACLFHLFRGTPILCADAADVDDNGAVNLTDAMSVLQYLYNSGSPPAAPFPERGADTTADSLACVQ
ncbi:MAG TPA: dockerin type I repeat-containing protein, partial [Planctomycetota bacterium]|nr:dockerin type I repeat-containing protein [Planctomycetota bacterium]